MSVRSIRLVGDAILTRKAAVTEFDGLLARRLTDMRDTLSNQPGLAVAAPQVGHSIRAFTYYKDPQNLRGPIDSIVNPIVVEATGVWTFNEGCLSFPGIFFEIERADRVVVNGYDVHGVERTIWGSGLLGRVFLHEIDHLDGVLFTSRLTPEQVASLQDFSNPAVRALRKGLRAIGAAR